MRLGLHVYDCLFTKDMIMITMFMITIFVYEI